MYINTQVCLLQQDSDFLLVFHFRPPIKLKKLLNWHQTIITEAKDIQNKLVYIKYTILNNKS